MPRLVRKISSVAKWTSPQWASVNVIPADAISSDLKTTNNTLSFWRIDTDEPQSEEMAILALVGTMQRLDKIDIAMIDENAFDGIRMHRNAGNTFISPLQHLHIDLADLNHESLGLAAKVLGGEVYGGRTRRLTRHRVKQLILGALDSGMIGQDAIPSTLRADLDIETS